MTPPGVGLELLVAAVEDDLRQAFDGLEDFESRPFDFDDGTTGHLISFRCAFGEGDQVRQFHALRLDDNQFSTLTLTVDGFKLNDEKRQGFLQCLAGTRIKDQ